MALRNKNHFYVYLNSSDINRNFQENSTTKFTTTLGEVIHLPQHENWRVALSSIYFSNQFVRDTSLFVTVQTSIIQPTFNQGKDLAVCIRKESNSSAVYDTTKENEFNFFEPIKKEFFPLATSHLSSIDISLTSKGGEQLTLGYGQPTLVVLEFKRIMEDANEFIVRFDSSDDVSGSSANFTAKVPPLLSINPQNRWKVSLNSIIYNGEFAQLPPQTATDGNYLEMSYFTAKARKKQKLEAEKAQSSNRVVKAKTVKPTVVRVPLIGNIFESNEELFQNVKLSLDRSTYEAFSGANKKLFTFSRISTNGKLTFTPTINGRFSIPHAWGALLGSTRRPQDDGRIYYQLTGKEDFSFEVPIDYKIWVPHFMLLYANFIDYTTIGSVQAPILRSIPLSRESNSQNEYRIYEPPSDELHSVSYSQLRDLQFQLRTISGMPIEFKHSNQKVIISLKFMKTN